VIVCDQDSHVPIVSPECGKRLSGELGSLSEIYIGEQKANMLGSVLCLWTKGGSELSQLWRR
jgi:hypothetical protein